MGTYSYRHQRATKYRAIRPRTSAAVRLDVEDQIEIALHPAELELIECDVGLCGCKARGNGSFVFWSGPAKAFLVGLRVLPELR
jgi:hypothetical protein